MNKRMSKNIFLLSIILLGATQTLDAARNKKKQNKLTVKEKTEKNCYYPNFKDPIGLIQQAWNISKCMNARKAISMKNKKKEAMLDQQKKNKLFKALPPELKTHIISFAPNKLKTFALINKEFYNLIFDKDKKLKTNFLHAAANINSWSDTPDEKVVKLFKYAFRTNDTLVFKNFKTIFETITKKTLTLPEAFDITQENLLNLAAFNGFINVIEELLNNNFEQLTSQEKIAKLFQCAFTSNNPSILNNLKTILEKITDETLHIPNDYKVTQENLLNLVAINGFADAIETLDEVDATAHIFVHMNKIHEALLSARKYKQQKAIQILGKLVNKDSKQIVQLLEKAPRASRLNMFREMTLTRDLK